VTVASCSFQDHSAAFLGRMRHVPGAARMAMRFTLFEETGGARPHRVRVRGLHRWHSSKPGVKAYGYRQVVRNLPENVSHRVRVEFRWYAADGTEVARTRRRSARCRQFDALPNLIAKLTGVAPTKTAGVVRYQAIVSNTGKATANDIPVRLTVDGHVVDTVTVASLAPGERHSLAIRGPACHKVVRIEADPDAAIAETSDGDNSHELTCAAIRNIG
jgi:hypothetical protein